MNNNKFDKLTQHYASILVILFLLCSTIFTIFALSLGAKINKLGYDSSLDRTSELGQELERYIAPQSNILYVYYSFSGNESIYNARPYKNQMVIASQKDLLQLKTVMYNSYEYDELLLVDTNAKVLGRSSVNTRENLIYNYQYTTNNNVFISDSEVTLLSEPLIEGKTWQSTSSLQATVTNDDVLITLGFGSFSGIEVTYTDGKGFERLDYYIKDLGLVKSQYKLNGKTTFTYYLNELVEDKIISKATLYTFDPISNDVYINTIDNAISTNPVYIEMLENMLKYSLTSLNSPLIQEHTHIKSVNIDRANNIAHIDFSSNFLKTTNYNQVAERLLLQLIANVTGNFYNVNYVKITSSGSGKIGGHVDFSTPFYVQIQPK